MQKSVQKIIKDIADKYNLSTSEVEEVFKSEFKLTKKIMEAGDKKDATTYKSVRLIKFGLFYVKDSVKKAYIENINNKKEKKDANDKN